MSKPLGRFRLQDAKLLWEKKRKRMCDKFREAKTRWSLMALRRHK